MSIDSQDPSAVRTLDSLQSRPPVCDSLESADVRAAESDALPIRAPSQLCGVAPSSAARLLKFLAVGGSGMLIDLSSYALLLAILPMGAARALSIWTAMTWNYFLNRGITFADRQPRHVLGQYLLFCLACLFGAVVNWSTSIGLVHWFAFFEHNKFLAAFCGIVAGTIFNYTLSDRVVFRNQSRPGCGQ